MNFSAKAFGQIKVRNAMSDDDRDTVILHFSSRIAFEEAQRQIMKSAGLKLLDAFYGYQLFDNADDAMESVRVFCRPKSQPIDEVLPA